MLCEAAMLITDSLLFGFFLEFIYLLLFFIRLIVFMYGFVIFFVLFVYALLVGLLVCLCLPV